MRVQVPPCAPTDSTKGAPWGAFFTAVFTDRHPAVWPYTTAMRSPTQTLFNAAAISGAIKALARRLLEADTETPALVGIHTNGVPIAHRIAAEIGELCGQQPDFGTLDITLYRDDLAGRALPLVRGSEVGFDVAARRIVLIDDVLFTGRTVRAALDELIEFGRPRRVELCVLVDRGHREFPIQADYAGFTVKTNRNEKIAVELTETGCAADRIVLVDAGGKKNTTRRKSAKIK